MIIDFHTHAFPDFLAKRAIDSLEQNSREPAFRDGTVASLIASMHRANIDRSVMMPIATNAHQVPAVNQFAALQNNKNGLLSFGSVHPQYKDRYTALRQIKEMGLYGIKLHPDFQDCFIDDPNMLEILQQAAKLNITVLVHSGMDPSYPTVHHCTPQRIARVLNQIPNLTLVAAHCGGHEYLEDAMQYLVGKNLYIDTSLLGRYPTEQVLWILTHHDPSRLLFATDTPWDDQKAAVERFLALPISDALKQKILEENAVALLKRATV